MTSLRFDALATSLPNRLSRRAALGAAGLGLTAGVAGASTLRAAQEATPAATPDPATGAAAETEYLFVQTFGSGTLTPHATETDLYTLTLTGGAAETVYFSDRPERITGTVPTTQFLDELGFTPDNPPNAAPSRSVAIRVFF